MGGRYGVPSGGAKPVPGRRAACCTIAHGAFQIPGFPGGAQTVVQVGGHVHICRAAYLY